MKNCKNYEKDAIGKKMMEMDKKNDNSVEQELKRPLRILINKF